MIDEPVTVVKIAYDGNTRRGLTARCRTGRGNEHVVALADVRFPEGSEAARLVAMYRAWLGLEITPDASVPRSPLSATPGGADRDIDLSHPVELIVLSIKERAARRCNDKGEWLYAPPNEQPVRRPIPTLAAALGDPAASRAGGAV